MAYNLYFSSFDHGVYQSSTLNRVHIDLIASFLSGLGIAAMFLGTSGRRKAVSLLTFDCFIRTVSSRKSFKYAYL